MKDLKKLRRINLICSLAGMGLMMFAAGFIARADDTGKRAVAFAAIALSFALIYLPRILMKKRFEAAEEQAEAERMEELPEYMKDGDEEDDFFSGEKAPLLLMGYPDDKIFAVFETERKYVFRWIGNESFGVKPERLPQTLPTDSYIPEKKDLVIDKREIAAYDLQMRHCTSTQLPNCASLHLTVNGKKKKFIVMDEHEECEIDGFFSAIRSRKTAPNERYIAGNERREQRKQRDIELAEYINARHTEPKRKLSLAVIIVACVALGASFAGLFMGLGSPWMWMWISCGAELALFLLGLLLPNQTSFVFAASEGKRLGMKHRYNVGFAMMVGALPLIGLSEAFQPIRFTDGLIVMCALAAIELILIFIFCKDARVHWGTTLLMLFLLFAVNVGLVPTVNAITDNTDDWELRTVRVTDKRESDNDNNVYIEIDGEELSFDLSQEDYDDIDVGDRVKIIVSPGGLGIEYVMFGG